MIIIITLSGVPCGKFFTFDSGIHYKIYNGLNLCKERVNTY